MEDIGERFHNDLEFVLSILGALVGIFFTVFILARLRYVAIYMGLAHPIKVKNKKYF